jgi:hypothetical protein
MLDEIDVDEMDDVELPPVVELVVRVNPRQRTQDEQLIDERYQRLLALGISEARAHAGSKDAHSYLSAKIYHRGV